LPFSATAEWTTEIAQQDADAAGAIGARRPE
jgi:hypothetical protein